MQKPNRTNESRTKQVSFLAEKVKRLQTSGNSEEMIATMRDYLQNERQAHATQIYEHTAHTAAVVPIARLRAI